MIDTVVNDTLVENCKNIAYFFKLPRTTVLLLLVNVRICKYSQNKLGQNWPMTEKLGCWLN